MKKIEILDSTLREGAQSEGISFSVEDKLHIINCLDRLGADIIECGIPTTPKDTELFSRIKNIKLNNARFSVFGTTRRKDTKPEEDSALLKLSAVDTPIVTIFGKCWGLHVTKVIGTDYNENLLMIEDSCRFLNENGKEVIFDAEHFFDGYKDNADYAINCLEAAIKGGAGTLCLCDTNGGTLPSEIGKITKTVTEHCKNIKIGIHCHNDSGTATASTIMAVESGAAQVQGTFLGIGERCGNAPLYSVIPNLQIKLGYTCIPNKNLKLLTQLSNEVSEICNTSIKRYEPFVGRSAFSHKAGTHVDGILKNPLTFEHISPETVGNSRRLLTSEMSGRAGILEHIKEIAPDIDKDSKELEDIIKELKRLEYIGYQFEGASAGFDLMVKRTLKRFKPSFELVSYRVLDELPYVSGCSATATIKIKVGGKLQISAAEGDGPVNALDKALREALEVFYPKISNVRLIDYKVRVLESKQATAAVVRVLITSTDGANVWTTVGLSENIIEASFHALVDSMEYKLKLL